MTCVKIVITVGRPSGSIKVVLCHHITGNYTCEIEWGGVPKQIVHHLEVQVPPQIEAILPGGYGQVERPLEAREGSSINLECRADGIPVPIIRWRTPVRKTRKQDLIRTMIHAQAPTKALA